MPRGPQSWESDGCSQVDGSTSSTRACNDSSAALGMLSCRPAHAARRSDREPFGIRSSRAPTRLRKARICRRVTLSRDSIARTLGKSYQYRVAHPRRRTAPTDAQVASG
jgi:hypothetical protein